jgi:hypothetical protein
MANASRTASNTAPSPTDAVSARADSHAVMSGHDLPRLIEEHHIRGRYGEDEIEATDERGRRWYHFRPEPRRRADLIGFNWTWWVVMWLFLLLVILPWGGAWRY